MTNKRNRNLHIVREPGESKVLWAGGEKAAKQAVEEMRDQAERDRKEVPEEGPDNRGSNGAPGGCGVPCDPPFRLMILCGWKRHTRLTE